MLLSKVLLYGVTLMVKQGRQLVRWFAIFLVAALAVSTVGLQPARAQTRTDRVPGEILVKFKPGTPAEAIADAHRQNGAQVKAVIPGIEVRVLRVPPGLEDDRVAAYARNPNVLYAEVN